MRILQLIDSLEAGGAERMAANYANALAEQIDFSGLVTTRKEGALKKQIAKKVSYLFLDKKKTIDFKAVLKLRKYISNNQVQIIQAHSSSFFLAVLVKISLPKVKIIWHDHYGNSNFLKERPKYLLQLASFFFSGIIAVNEKLKTWSLEVLHHKNGVYLPNFAIIENEIHSHTILRGQVGKRIVCLANLRPQKNHFLLLDVAKKLKESHPEWTFHLLGKDFQDNYSTELKLNIKNKELEKHVFVYDSCSDVSSVLAQVEIGILTSNSEGLPVALLEYALCKKVVLFTNVGQVSSIVEDGKNGFLVESNNLELFYNRLVQLIEDKSLQASFGEKLHQKVVDEFSENSSIEKYIHWIRTTILNE
jgi:glycosyltransferase involved in cell wall biosynthesis